MIFSRDKKDSNEPKKRSTFGLLFNPEFGRDIKPIGESMGMFVRLIAMIFASNKLFPKDHPALMGVQGARITMGEVITTAWRGLSFTREGLPKVILFFAVVGMLVFTALFVLTLFASLFVGQAHAAGMFEPPGGSDPASTTDLAISWIAYLFQGVTPNSNVSGAGQAMLSSTSLQSTLYSALRFYSNAILVFAGIILLYHLLSMVAETAHHGAVMGKRASQIWAPIRLVVAIGLLVPISTGVGLNTGQYIVIQMAKWGSGLASNVWSTIVTGLGNTQFTIPPSALPMGIDRMVMDMIRMRACAKAFNAEVNAGGYDSTYLIGNVVSNVQPACNDTSGDIMAAGSCTNFSVPQTRYYITNQHVSNICGYYELYPTSTGLASTALNSTIQTIRTAHSTALSAANNEIDWVADNVMMYVSDAAKGGTVYTFNGNTPAAAIQAYKNSLSISLNGLQSNWNSTMQSLSQTWANQGWVQAGAWFNTIARMQGAVAGAIDSTMPLTNIPPTGINDPSTIEGINHWYSNLLNSNTNINSIYTNTRNALVEFDNKIIGSTPTQLTSSAATAGLPAPDPSYNDSYSVKAALTAVDWVGRTFNIWGPGDGLIVNFGTTTNPFAELVNLGYSYTKFGIELLAWGMGGKIASNLLTRIPFVGPILGEIGGFAAGIVLALGMAFLSCGIALAFVVPLIPFMKFFFNIITWMLNVFEAIISAPLFALAHLNPEGEGLPGNMARTGYFFLLSILLRPVMMVFGLIAGLLLFFVVISFLNASFNIAVQGSGSAGGQLAVLSRVIFSVMYAMVAYTAANKCFQSISFFTEHTMKWIGAGGPETRPMGDQGMMHNITGAMGGYMLANWMRDAAGGIGSSMRKQPPEVSNKGIAAALRETPPTNTSGSGSPAITGGDNSKQIPSEPPLPPFLPKGSNDPYKKQGDSLLYTNPGAQERQNLRNMGSGVASEKEIYNTERRVTNDVREGVQGALQHLRGQPNWNHHSLEMRQNLERQVIAEHLAHHARDLRAVGGDVGRVAENLNNELLSHS